MKNWIRQRTNRIQSYLIIFLLIQIASVFVVNVTFAQGQFWSEWGDGKAELNLYKTEVPRYGEMRSGYSLLIFVTEDFDTLTQVKSESEKPSTVKVMKLNHIKKFVTGIYDYSLMTSVFSPLRIWNIGESPVEAIMPIKVSFSSQEWCGNYYEQLNSRVNGFERVVHSYFEGEGDITDFVKERSHQVSEDDLLIRARELIAPFSFGEYWLLSSPMYSRLMHTNTGWQNAEVKREVEPVEITVPFGTFKARKFTVRTSLREHRIWVEDQIPKRILKWEVEQIGNPALTERSELVKSIREPYWQENKLGFESLRTKLGIPDLK